MTDRRTVIQSILQAVAVGMIVPSEVNAASLAKPQVDHISLSVAQPHDEIVKKFEAMLGRWDPVEAGRLVSARAPWHDLEDAVARMAGPTGLMIFTRINQGEFVSLHKQPRECCLYLVGNPVVATGIIEIDLRGSFYVPFRVAIYGNEARTTVITYDKPSSFLEALGHPELIEVGQMLDGKIKAVMDSLGAK